MAFFKWLWAVVYKHGWWRKHPKDWKELSKDMGKVMRALPIEDLPHKYKKRGTPIHSIRCEVCKETWYTSCKLPLCNKLACWLKYHEKGVRVHAGA